MSCWTPTWRASTPAIDSTSDMWPSASAPCLCSACRRPCRAVEISRQTICRHVRTDVPFAGHLAAARGRRGPIMNDSRDAAAFLEDEFPEHWGSAAQHGRWPRAGPRRTQLLIDACTRHWCGVPARRSRASRAFLRGVVAACPLSMFHSALRDAVLVARRLHRRRVVRRGRESRRAFERSPE
jgi:hypothetical protein